MGTAIKLKASCKGQLREGVAGAGSCELSAGNAQAHLKSCLPTGCSIIKQGAHLIAEAHQEAASARGTRKALLCHCARRCCATAQGFYVAAQGFCVTVKGSAASLHKANPSFCLSAPIADVPQGKVCQTAVLISGSSIPDRTMHVPAP